MSAAPPRKRTNATPALMAIVLVVGFLAGLVVGRTGNGGAGNQATLTAIELTRDVETRELAMLRTQVAGGVAPTPIATRAPDQQWTFAAATILPVPAPDELTPIGQYISVTIEVTNHGSAAAPPPVAGLTLIDEAGNRYSVDDAATRAIVDEGYDREIPAGMAETRSIMFDVALPTGIRFTLVSADDPGLQALLMIEAQG